MWTTGGQTRRKVELNYMDSTSRSSYYRSGTNFETYSYSAANGQGSKFYKLKKKAEFQPHDSTKQYFLASLFSVRWETAGRGRGTYPGCSENLQISDHQNHRGLNIFVSVYLSANLAWSVHRQRRSYLLQSSILQGQLTDSRRRGTLLIYWGPLPLTQALPNSLRGDQMYDRFRRPHYPVLYVSLWSWENVFVVVNNGSHRKMRNI